MRIHRIEVESRQSVMTTATGDYATGIKLEAVFSEEEQQDQAYIQKVIKSLQDSADYIVNEHIKKVIGS